MKVAMAALREIDGNIKNSDQPFEFKKNHKSKGLIQNGAV